MFGFSIKAAVVSSLIGLTTVFAAGSSVQAAPPMPAGASSYNGAPMPRHSRPNVHGNQRHDRFDRRQQRPSRADCTIREAGTKAARMGVRNARVNSKRSTIRVSGFRQGRPVTMVFSKAPGCPILY